MRTVLIAALVARCGLSAAADGGADAAAAADGCPDGPTSPDGRNAADGPERYVDFGQRPPGDAEADARRAELMMWGRVVGWYRVKCSFLNTASRMRQNFEFRKLRYT